MLECGNVRSSFCAQINDTSQTDPAAPRAPVNTLVRELKRDVNPHRSASSRGRGCRALKKTCSSNGSPRGFAYLIEFAA